MIIMITEQGAKLSIDKGKIIIERDGIKNEIPKEQVDNVTVFGNVHLTTPLIKHCLTRGIPISYFSLTGKYYGRTSTQYGYDVLKLKKQLDLIDNQEFVNTFTFLIVEAKTNNQLTLLRRYKKYKPEVDEDIKNIIRIRGKLKAGMQKEQALGYEGLIARYYFQAISKIMPDEFKFKGRNRRPPRDPFNSMISLGYTILLHEIIGQIENVGLSPYGGFIHGHSRKNPSLASDLIEEYRPVLVDSLALSMILNQEVKIDDFEVTGQGVFIKEKALKKFLRGLQEKLKTKQKYLDYIEESLDYRRAIYHQCKRLKKAVVEGQANIYEPTRIR